MVRGFPWVLFFKANKIYKYEGDLDKNALLEYLSADNYLDSKVQVADLQDFAAKITGVYSLIGKLMKMGYDFLEAC